MSFLDAVTAVFAPYACLGCGNEGPLLCKSCYGRLPPIAGRCFHCLKPTPGNSSCANCRQASGLYVVMAAAAYDGVARELVWRLKFEGAQAAAKLMARQMVTLVPDIGDAAIVPVPTATSRVRRRGYDQARLLARALSRQSGLPMLPLLARRGQHHQVGADRATRLAQLSGAFRVPHPVLAHDRHLILVDDVLTTGATLTAAAAALHATGARRVSALTFAQA